MGYTSIPQVMPIYGHIWPCWIMLNHVESCWIMLNHNVKREHDQMILIQHDFVIFCDVVNFLPVRVAWGWTAWACLRGWHTRHCAVILEIPGIWRSLKSCGTRKAFQNWQSSIFFVLGDPGFWETPTLPLFVYFQAVTVRSESVGYCANQLQSHRDMADEVTMWPAKSLASFLWGATKCMRCRCCLLNCHGPLDSTQDDSCSAERPLWSSGVSARTAAGVCASEYFGWKRDESCKKPCKSIHLHVGRSYLAYSHHQISPPAFQMLIERIKFPSFISFLQGIQLIESRGSEVRKNNNLHQCKSSYLCMSWANSQAGLPRASPRYTWSGSEALLGPEFVACCIEECYKKDCTVEWG